MRLITIVRAACAGVALFLALAASPATAQEGTPSGNEALALPAAIYSGVCGESGELGNEVVYELGLIGPTVGEEADVPEADEVRGLQLSPPVMTLEETIDASFDDLLGDSHAVVVASENGEEPAACGQLGGVVADGRLAVGLRPLTDERYYGVAVIEDTGRRAEIAKGQLLITIYVFQEQGPIGPLGHGSTPTADASP